VDTSTFIIVNAATCEVITANRNRDVAEEMGDKLQEFDVYNRYYMQEVTLH